MASVFVGSLTCPASTGNQSVTGVGFQPNLIIFLAPPSDTATADGLHGDAHAVGVAVDSTHRWAMGGSDIGGGYDHGSTGHCIRYADGSGTITLGADFVSHDADGFTINWGNVTNGVIIPFIALKVTNAVAMTFDSATATGNQAITGAGFQPDLVLLGGTFNSNALPYVTNRGGSIRGLGAMDASGNQFCMSTEWTGGSPSTYRRNDRCFGITSGGGSLQQDAHYVSMDSDGFTINWDTANGTARRMFALCIKLPNAKIINFNQPGSTGNSSVTGTGFKPDSVMLFGSGYGHSASSQTSGYTETIAAAVSSSQRWSDNTTSKSNYTYRGYLDRAKFPHDVYGSTSPGNVADFVSHDSDGFTLNWTTLNPPDSGTPLWSAICLRADVSFTATGASALPHLVASGQGKKSGTRYYSPTGVSVPGAWRDSVTSGIVANANSIDDDVFLTANDDDYVYWPGFDNSSDERVEFTWPTSIIKPKAGTSQIVIRVSRLIPWK